MMKSIPLFFILFLFLTGCHKASVTEKGIKIGDCLKEINKKYASGAAPKNNIYKVEDISVVKNSFVVTKFNNRSKHYLGYKSPEYFDENSTFKYYPVLCPDGTSKVGITSKIKNVDI